VTPDLPPETAGAPAGPDVEHLSRRRGLDVPAEDRQPLTEYWAHITQLRAAIDERDLADSEIAVTWTAVPPHAD
jgi:hypothetical protein